ncbi:MAG: L-piperidine-6-carboxylate dehydrogenase [Pseudobdellovibrio sp.]
MNKYNDLLQKLNLKTMNPAICTGLTWHEGEAQGKYDSFSPIDGEMIGSTGKANQQNYEEVMKTAQTASLFWKKVPAPQRGEIVRQIGQEFRNKKEFLGDLVSLEMGKSRSEGHGEVQEIIDICDFATGLSRQLYGLTMPSERPQHRMMEQWHPLGVVGIISAFNFPVAVWAWNSMIAAVCGNVSIWKPSEKTPLTAVACFQLMSEVLKKNNVPEGVMSLVIGEASEVGESMISDKRVALVSATGSTRMGKHVAQVVASRLGKSILELGGNNAIILTKNANLEMAIPAIVFGAVGTAGQRCTSTRRLIIDESIYEKVKTSLLKAYKNLKIGNPLDTQNHLGPLIDKAAVSQMQTALKTAEVQGAKILTGGEILTGAGYESGCYVRPALVEASHAMKIVHEETFAPILYLTSYSGELARAIELQNSVSQGLSSSIFTEDMRSAEEFLSPLGSDCGIANVNIGTSGAEIGGAFGGEKETGGGRESGSDSWKAYMRRQTNTINYGKTMPLAQGIKFEI